MTSCKLTSESEEEMIVCCHILSKELNAADMKLVPVILLNGLQREKEGIIPQC